MCDTFSFVHNHRIERNTAVYKNYEVSFIIKAECIIHVQMFPLWHTKQFVKKHALRKLELVMNHPDQKHIMNKYAVFKINKTLFSPHKSQLN